MVVGRFGRFWGYRLGLVGRDRKWLGVVYYFGFVVLVWSRVCCGVGGCEFGGLNRVDCIFLLFVGRCWFGKLVVLCC